MDAFCFNYQHVDCLYILFKYRFSGNLLSRVDNSLVMCKGYLISTTKTEEKRQKAQHREKKTPEEKVQKTFVELHPETQIDSNYWISLWRQN